MSAPAAEIPKAPMLPVVGSAIYYFRDQLGYLERASRQGDIVEMRFLQQRAWLVNDAALVEQVLIKSASLFVKDLFLRELRKVLGEGLLTAEGAFWKRQRRLIQPAFHREKIAGYGSIMVEHTERMIAAWRPGSTLDLHHEMMSVTADIVTQCLFGTDAGDTREVAACIDAMMARFNDPVMLLVPGLERLPLPSNRRFRKVAPRLDAIVRGFIAARRAMGDPAPGDDLLAMLLNARDEDGSRMDDRTVRDEVLILFLAGHETTALALSWAFYLLAENPEVEAKLHAELDAVLGDRAPGFDDVPKLKYTECVVHETLRLRPPAWALGRESTAPMELGTHHFDTGAWFWMVPWTLHRDARHFPEPERFHPERWQDGLAKRLPRCAYLPFGAGPRVCIGNQFAMMEAVLMLATVARRFSMRVEPGFRVEPEATITLRFKRGLRVQLTARQGATPDVTLRTPSP